MTHDAPADPATFRVMEWLEGVQAKIYEETKDLTPEEEIAYYQRAVAESPWAELVASLPKIERSRREMGRAASAR
ncbi:MAG: hypothetical protein ACKVT1_15465 [Dehalococcoidia bacterium]